MFRFPFFLSSWASYLTSLSLSLFFFCKVEQHLQCPLYPCRIRGGQDLHTVSLNSCQYLSHSYSLPGSSWKKVRTHGGLPNGHRCSLWNSFCCLDRQLACFIFQPSQCLAAPAPGIGNNDPVSPSLRCLKDPKCLSWQVAPRYSRQSLTGTRPGCKWAFPLVVLFDRYLGWAD